MFLLQLFRKTGHKEMIKGNTMQNFDYGKQTLKAFRRHRTIYAEILPGNQVLDTK